MCGVEVAPDLRALVGASEAVPEVVGLRLNQAGEKAKISRDRRIKQTNTKCEMWN